MFVLATPAFVLSVAKAGALAGPVAALGVLGLLRRRPRLRTLFLVLFAIPYGLAVWAFLIEPNTLAVRRVTVAAPQWQGAPLKIGVISDPHFGAPHMSEARMRRIVARMNRERPDVIVLLGDYAGGHEPAEVRAAPERSKIQRGIATFARLKAPLGVVGVIGNHDVWYDEPATERALAAAGVVVLDNSAVRISREGGPFWIAGLADLTSREKTLSIPEAFAEVPEGADSLLLTHWPDPFATAPDSLALTLAGHTHCGQVNLPILGRTVHASNGSRRWGCGLYREGGRQLYVSGGIGSSILPVRFRAPPEIAVVTLKSQPLLASAPPSH